MGAYPNRSDPISAIRALPQPPEKPYEKIGPYPNQPLSQSEGTSNHLKIIIRKTMQPCKYEKPSSRIHRLG